MFPDENRSPLLISKVKLAFPDENRSPLLISKATHPAPIIGFPCRCRSFFHPAQHGCLAESRKRIALTGTRGYGGEHPHGYRQHAAYRSEKPSAVIPEALPLIQLVGSVKPLPLPLSSRLQRGPACGEWLRGERSERANLLLEHFRKWRGKRDFCLRA